MISPHKVAMAEFIIDESGAVDTLFDGAYQGVRGRRNDRSRLRALLIGMLLSIAYRGSATVRSAHKVLTEELVIDDKVRLGVARIERIDGQARVIDIEEYALYSWFRTFNDLLSYGDGEAPTLSDSERARREAVIQQFADRLLDVFAPWRTTTAYAIDASGIWSWSRGRRIPFKGTVVDIAPGPAADAGGDPLTEALGLDETPEGLDASALGLSDDEAQRILEDPEGWKKAIAALDFAEPDDTDRPEPGTAGTQEVIRQRNRKQRPKDEPFDLDAHWGVKTGKNGNAQIFFGFDLHTMVTIPGKQRPDAVPVLVTRFRLTPASTDVVDPTFSMIDSLDPGAVRDIVVDRHYPYKAIHRWSAGLRERSIDQHFDLRKDQLVFPSVERMRWLGGRPHCPAMPEAFLELRRPGLTASEDQHAQFRSAIERRYAYALQRNSRPDADGKARWGCPALEGKVGCPLRAGTVQVAALTGRPIIERPPDPATDGEPLPRCCSKRSIEITPPATIAKTLQPHYHGNVEWYRWHNQRSYVEGAFGNLKNHDRENVRRGHHRVVGLTKVSIVLALSLAAMNLRLLRIWNERVDGPTDHPMLQPEPTTEESQLRAVTADDLAAMLAELETDETAPPGKGERRRRAS